MKLYCRRQLKAAARILMSLGKPRFTCPICNYNGIFLDANPVTGRRKYCQCPSCHSAERHRLQRLVLDQILPTINPAQARILHFAPEPFFRGYLKEKFQEYISADLHMPDVDIICDITNLPFPDQSFDVVFASHVLEHVSNDRQALVEIKRILKSPGIAILPVPVVNEKTVEYPQPNPDESGHVRAPGKDYFDRYRTIFSEVKLYTSSDFPEKYQPFLYEDRSHYPNQRSPFRTQSTAERHDDIVPVCMA